MSISKAIEAVKAVSTDLLILPGSQTYDAITSSYFTELERELKPAAFLCPRTTSEVSDVVKSMKPFAVEGKIAICGSGQQATPGVANVRDGLTIHLRNLKGVEVNPDKKIVSVAAGETWGNVFEKVAALGFGVVGQRHSSGGIGGDAVQGE
jgi:FAD/FMN-containing dehydrogenase